MKRTVPLHEFMPYGAPDLQAAARPQLSRALVLSSSLAVATWLALSAVASLILPQPVVPEIPTIIDVLIPPREVLPEPKGTSTPPAEPTPPREGRFEPVEQAPPLPPESAIDYGRLGDQVQPGDGVGPTVVPPAQGIAPADPDQPVIYVEVLPVAVTEVLPEYPDIARQAMVEGRVIVLVLVGRDGRVREAKVDLNHNVPMLDEAALEAARRWVFSPALVNDRPVAVWTAIPFRFTLQ